MSRESKKEYHNFASGKLREGHPLDDYMELLELTIIVIGEVLQQLELNLKWLKPTTEPVGWAKLFME